MICFPKLFIGVIVIAGRRVLRVIFCELIKLHEYNTIDTVSNTVLYKKARNIFECVAVDYPDFHSENLFASQTEGNIFNRARATQAH
jgi:peptide methionine sulfoxide reductase MsrB